MRRFHFSKYFLTYLHQGVNWFKWKHEKISATFFPGFSTPNSLGMAAGKQDVYLRKKWQTVLHQSTLYTKLRDGNNSTIDRLECADKYIIDNIKVLTPLKVCYDMIGFIGHDCIRHY